MAKTIVKLASHPYAQAQVRFYADGSMTLISYSTPVVHVTSDGFVAVDGLYSATTRKHIGYFAKEYLAPLGYHDLKAACENGYIINYKTREIIGI